MIYSREKVINDYKSEKYIIFRKWYETKYTKEEHKVLRDEYYIHLEKVKDYISFSAFVLYYDSTLHINVISDFYKSWSTAEGYEVKSIHPPTQALILKNNSKILETQAYTQIIPEENLNVSQELLKFKNKIIIQIYVFKLLEPNYQGLKKS